MPLLKNSVPKYRKHRASGSAIVTLNGKDHYLGPHGTKASKAEYDRLVSEWLANGRKTAQSAESITVVELVVAYLRWANGYYVKNGKPTDTVSSIKNAVRTVKDLYGRQPADQFGPRSLQCCMDRMVEFGWARTYCNDCQAMIKRMFKWGASQELVSAEVFHALQTVSGLRKGRTDARETTPILPVDDAIVAATLPHVSPIVADMVRLQRLTGMRPAEVCMMRPVDIDTKSDVWTYRPESHKTEHHGHSRVIAIGPQGQDVLRKYLVRGADDYCFSPVDSERKRRRELTESRKTPASCGNRPGSNRKRDPKRTVGQCYTPDSYRQAIQRACDLAFKPADKLTGKALAQWQSDHRWSPNQLRHSAATQIRSQFGLEAAQVTLGHSNANITQVYAERDLEKAVEVARKIG